MTTTTPEEKSLKYCENCVQMTNHTQETCLKCGFATEKATPEEIFEKLLRHIEDLYKFRVFGSELLKDFIREEISQQHRTDVEKFRKIVGDYILGSMDDEFTQLNVTAGINSEKSRILSELDKEDNQHTK